uniref:Elongation factor P C-terminal domain-containing protein n=1 Tax=Chlamydomonas leiostraca TaxID=1034604 RepID=A0A7S0WQK4_9CHLO
MLRVARSAVRALVVASQEIAAVASCEASTSGTSSWQGHLLQAWRNASKKASQVRAGDVLSRDGRLLKVTKFTAEHGRARAAGFISLELVDMRAGPDAGGRTALKLKPDEVVGLADLEARELQVLYVEGSVVHLMDSASFEQVEVPAPVFGPPGKWLLPDVMVEVKFLGEEPVTGLLPPKVSVKVVEARPAVAREDGSTNRHVVVECGANVLCPGHIDKGDVIVINTAEGTYVSKA